MGYVPLPPPSRTNFCPTYLGHPMFFCAYCGNGLHTDDGGRCRSCGATPGWDVILPRLAALRRGEKPVFPASMELPA